MKGKKNLTLALDEDLIVKARVVAARRRTSLTKLVRQSIEAIVSTDRGGAQAKVRLKALMRKPKLMLGKESWSRDELHDRSDLR